MSIQSLFTKLIFHPISKRMMDLREKEGIYLHVITQGILQEKSELAVTVRNVGVLLSQGHDYISQTRKRLVDILCLLEPVTSNI